MDDWGNGEAIDGDNDYDDDDDDDMSDDDDDSSGSEEEKMKNMEAFIRSFHNCDYDIEFDNDNALRLDMDRYGPSSVRPTQASYIKPDNWVVWNRLGLERFKGRLQTCINLVSRGTSLSFNLRLIHNDEWDYEFEDNEAPIVWHEPILDGYWNEFEDNIRRRQLRSIAIKIQGIYIENVEIKKERLAALVDIFRNGRATDSIGFVSFINANICGEGIVYLSKLVDVSSQLQTLVIRHNRIDNMESAHCISRSLKSHAPINQLYLAHCNFGSNPEILLIILQSDVKHISLSNNNIDSLGAVKIAEYLEGDPPIEVLSLSHNRLNDGDIIHISQVLKRNTNLKSLNLDGNNFTSIGVKALLTCVFDSSSLNAISESNHTPEGMNFFHIMERLDCCIDRLLELDRTQKIMFALQDKDSLLKYLANVPVGLMPEVLAFLLQRNGNHCHGRNLSTVYSTMRLQCDGGICLCFNNSI